jgi:D-sedoheptulose 7-phosphate isomerase
MPPSIQDIIASYAARGARTRLDFFTANQERVGTVAKVLAACLQNEGKIILCGNGGSAADAQHLAAEFVSRFQIERRPLPAIALTTDTSVITAIGNDDGFEHVFRKQLQALARPADVLLALSTSGNSPNIVLALEQAATIGMTRIGLAGCDGGLMRDRCEHLLQVDCSETPLIQEVHISLGHLLCALVDHLLFETGEEHAHF